MLICNVCDCSCRRSLAMMVLVALVAGSGPAPSAVVAQEKQQEQPLSKNGAMAEALGQTRIGNHQKALEIVEELSQRFPNDLEIKVQLVKRLQRRSDQLSTTGQREAAHALYLRTGQVAREIIANVPADQLEETRKLNCHILYNEACAYAQMGEPEKCIESLRECLAWGFVNFDHLLNDHDLFPVADSEAFKTMLGEGLQNYQATIAEMAKTGLEKFNPLDFPFQLPDLEGNLVAPGEPQGKVVVVAFWATGNAASRTNLATLRRVRNNYPPDEVEIYAVGCERTKDGHEAKAMIEKYLEDTGGLPFPVLMAHPRIRTEMKRKQGFPTTMILDQNGKVRVALAGQNRYQAVVGFIEQLKSQEPNEDSNQLP